MDMVHTGPGTLAGRLMRSFWQPVARMEDLGPGELQPIRILSQDFALYRGESGEPHLLDFRCAHRRTQLNTGWVEGENVRCYFHGWVYDQSGQCIEQPAEPQPFCERIKIGSYPTREYLGLIFAYLGEGESPPFRRFLALENHPDNWVINNSKNVWGNNFMASPVTDPSHGNFVHAASYQDLGREFPRSIRCEETEHGHTTFVELQDGQKRLLHSFFPNVNYAKRFRKFDGQWVARETLGWQVPIDDDTYMQIGIWMDEVPEGAKERHAERLRKLREREEGLPTPDERAWQVLRGESRIENLGPDASAEFDQQRLFNIQDQVVRIGMGRVPDLHLEHLGQADAAEITNRQIWQRELRALAEGRPLKKWGEVVELTVELEGALAAPTVD
jgi:5,5'-dehydrodivanillate O-demethylase oxygenase subunit